MIQQPPAGSIVPDFMEIILADDTKLDEGKIWEACEADRAVDEAYYEGKRTQDPESSRRYIEQFRRESERAHRLMKDADPKLSRQEKEMWKAYDRKVRGEGSEEEVAKMREKLAEDVSNALKERCAGFGI